MIGKTLAHYEVLGLLGKGGMGEVYRARDTKLGREVAIKILPVELSQDTARRARFEREAQTIAALNHPNVVTLYAVEEAEGISFLAMELVEGQTLDELIPPGGLPVARFLELGQSLCDAVAAAHAKGITHRDLKPQNVMIDREGRVKVLDFGLAKILESAWQQGDATIDVTAHATREGAIVGTAAYMSPEQAEGKEVDARSDVFSLGVLLYEMLTGHRAFQGDTHLSTLTAVLRDEPRAVLEIRPDLPRQITRILRHCLEKDPERRHGSARGIHYDLEMLAEEVASGEYEAPPVSRAPSPSHSAHRSSPSGELPPSHSSDSGFSPAATAVPPSTPTRAKSGSRARWMGGAALLVVLAALFIWSQRGDDTRELASDRNGSSTESKEPTIVVFPFQNLGPPEDAYFAAGITDEIVTSLVQVDGLRVLSRTSSQQYDRTGKTMQQVADDLGVDYVLEGTVRWQRSDEGPSRVRVTPQLVSAHEDEQVWGSRYDRTMEEIFEVQTEIAEEVVRQLGGALAMDVEALEPEPPTENMEAYHAYLRAKSIVDGTRYSPDEWFLAEQLLERAVNLDPDFHLAWAELAKVEAGMCHFGWDRSEARLAKSRTAIDRAAGLAPDDPFTHFARGYYHYWGLKNYGPALSAFHLAERERPNDPEVMLAIAYVQRRQGYYAEAIEKMLRAVEYSPNDGSLCYHIGETYSVLKEYEEADRWARKGILLEPDRALIYAFALWLATLTGDSERAREVVASIPVHSDSEVWSRCMLSAYHLGNYSEALEFTEQLPDANDSQYFVICRPLAEAMIYKSMDREGAARKAFTRAEEVLRLALRESPDSGTMTSAYAKSLAGLGRTQEAVEFARRALNMYPANKDVWIHSWRVYDLAIVQILSGQFDDAMQTLRELADTDTDALSPALLRKSPAFDPLRDREDFEALVRSQS